MMMSHRAATRILQTAVLLGAVASMAGAQPRLTPASRRITNEAIAQDYRTIDEWRRRVKSLPADGIPLQRYQRAKAEHWMAFLESEYADNERGPVVDEALERVATLVSAVETSMPTLEDEAPLPGTRLVRPDLHTRFVAHRQRTLSCAPEQLGEYAVKLISAAHAPGAVGRMNAATALRRVEQLDAELAASKCGEPLLAAAPAEPATPATPALPVPVAASEVSSQQDTVTQRILVPGRVHFGFARSRLSARTRAILDAVALRLRDATYVQIEMTGHTDRHGSARANRRLGLRRAQRVERYLAALGLDRSKMQVRSAGESQLLDRRRTRAADARNRRVELRISGADGTQFEMQLDADDLQVRRSRRK
jgi:outer membrane protein OmpA-like peptidoglycan-associated protein